MRHLLQNTVSIPRILPYFMQAVAWVLLWKVILRGKLEIRGKESLTAALQIHKESNIGIVFASNHTSELDPALIFTGMSPFHRSEFPTYFVAGTKKLFKQPKFGWRRFIYGGIIFHISGAFPIKPNQHDYKEALSTHIEVLRGGDNVCIFPEGKIKKDNEPIHAHGGVAYMAESAGSPILPIAITRNKKQTLVEYLPLIWPQDIIANTQDPNRYRLAAEEIMYRINSARSFR